MHVQVDIETLGSGKNGRILQLGAVGFDFNEGVLEPHELIQIEDRCFNMRVADYPGATEEAGNHTFWDDPKQAEAKAAIERMQEYPLPAVLEKFSKFCKEWLGKRGKIWAKPPQYDLRLLRDAYELAGIDCPWHYSHEHDVRTLLYVARQVPLSGFKAPDVSGARLLPHYALHDAVEQAVICQAAFRSLSHFASKRFAERRDTLEAIQTGDDDAEPLK